MSKTNAIKIVAIDHHRNGISGEPFSVVLFRDPEITPPYANGVPPLMVATVFEGKGQVSVFCVDRLVKEDIAFGSNSWRGDRYENALRNAIERYEMTCSDCGAAADENGTCSVPCGR